MPIESGANIQRECRIPGSGPGDHLGELLKKLGAAPSSTCRCPERIDQMNRWDVSGCREHRGEIVAWLKEAYAATNWPMVIRSAGAAAFSGLAAGLTIAWVRGGIEGVLGFLINESIRRAEAQPAGGDA